MHWEFGRALRRVSRKLGEVAPGLLDRIEVTARVLSPKGKPPLV